jgi:2-methylcitrate dehydratase PrpD
MRMGNAALLTGLEAKLSVQHCAAAALTYGQVGVHEFTEGCVNDRAVAALRARATLVEDSANSTRSQSADGRNATHARSSSYHGAGAFARSAAPR